MINRVIRLLILSDLTLFFAFGLLAPIFAIFITQNIEGGTLKVIGLASSFYWLARTLTTVPLSRIMDKTDGEIDEYFFMLVGSYAMAFIPLFYMISSQPWHIYALGFINGLFNSMAVPGWRIIFTNHIDRGQTGYEWSMEDVGVGLSIGLSSYIGAFMAEKFGFELVFILITIVGVSGVSFFIIPLRESMKSLKELRKTKRFGAPYKVDTLK